MAPLGFDPIEEAARQWRAHWGTAATPAMAAVTSIMRAEQILMKRLNELLKQLDLTFPRYEGLMILYLSRRGALPFGKIGERLQVHPTSVTNLIDGLERAGYVTRERHTTDRRATLASITPQGRAAAEAATEALNDAKFGTSPLHRKDLESITTLLRRLRADADNF
jgi:DNA-binding MarR family transcriptional regulator